MKNQTPDPIDLDAYFQRIGYSGDRVLSAVQQLKPIAADLGLSISLHQKNKILPLLKP